MAGANSTTLEVQFGGAFTREGTLVMERSNKETDDNDSLYFRIHGFDGHTIRSTSGSVHREKSNLTRFTSEFLSFSGANAAQLSYPGATKVSITKFGAYYGSDGTLLATPTFSYDGTRNTVSTSASTVHGLVLVEYDAPYELWIAKFSGKCPSVEPLIPPQDVSNGSPDDDTAFVGREPMLIMGFKEAVLEASLQLEAPLCEYGGNTVNRSLMDTQSTRLVIEEDQKDSGRLRVGKESGKLHGAGAVRVYPGFSSITLESSSGTLKTHKSTKLWRTVKEVLRYNNSSSASLKYQPDGSGGVVAKPIGDFYTAFENKFDPDARVWGDNITAVKWESKHTFTGASKRAVFRDEVAIANFQGKSVPCYGTMEVTYQTSYWLADFTFEYISRSEGFKDITFIAFLGDETGSLTLTGPSIGGRKST